jgi:hypothetical protein
MHFIILFDRFSFVIRRVSDLEAILTNIDIKLRIDTAEGDTGEVSARTRPALPISEIIHQ